MKKFLSRIGFNLNNQGFSMKHEHEKEDERKKTAHLIMASAKKISAGKSGIPKNPIAARKSRWNWGGSFKNNRGKNS